MIKLIDIIRGILNEGRYDSISLKNASTDDYNEIYVNGEKVGYIILSPARKEIKKGIKYEQIRQRLFRSSFGDI